MGTALTEDQIMEAWKIVNEPILCFDGDNAGQKAALRSVERALPILKAGYSLRFMFLPDKMDPDEFLKAKGKDEFLNLMQNTTPLMQLLWDKNTKDKASSTPEQKALIEKTLMEEVANIKDEKVKSYYLQEMQKRIYETYGRGTLRAYSAKSGNYRKKSSSIKPPLTDIDIRFILASMIVYPELIGDFEEKLLMFDITKFKLYNMLQYAVDIFHEDTDITSESLIKSLKTNFEKDFGSLWEVGMLKSQNPRINEIKRQIDCLMIAVQIKELNKDINEYRIKLEKDSATDEDYQHYLSLISERDILIKESNAM